MRKWLRDNNVDYEEVWCDLNDLSICMLNGDKDDIWDDNVFTMVDEDYGGQCYYSLFKGMNVVESFHCHDEEGKIKLLKKIKEVMNEIK